MNLPQQAVRQNPVLLGLAISFAALSLTALGFMMNISRELSEIHIMIGRRLQQLDALEEFSRDSVQYRNSYNKTEVKVEELEKCCEQLKRRLNIAEGKSQVIPEL